MKQYGMMQKYDDSQEFLTQHPHLVCEETANSLVLWCIDLEIEEVCISGQERSLENHCKRCEDSQEFLTVCEETANSLVLWCIDMETLRAGVRV